MSGSNHSSNIVTLSVEEHAEAHRKLYEEHGKWQDKIAADMLSGQIKSDEVRRELCRARMLNDNPMNNPESVKKMLESRKWYKPSVETKAKTSASCRGKKKSNTDNMNKSKLKTYLVTTPAGEELIINDMPKFCSTNNLQASLMYQVASGYNNRKAHKKFKCRLLYHEQTER
jgi:hypothetical protein